MALETSENTVSDNEINSKGEVGVGKLNIGKYKTLKIIFLLLGLHPVVTLMM